MQELENSSDAELFSLLKNEDETAKKAFTILYSRYASRVYAYCRRFLGNKEEAQDVFQETFIRFYQSAKQDREMTNLPAFLLTISRNLCVNAKRKEKSMVDFESVIFPDNNETTNLNDKKELLELIKRALELLPDEYKEMFILREYDGLSYQEIADVTGNSIATVKIRIFRAKQKIREILAPYLSDLSKY